MVIDIFLMIVGLAILSLASNMLIEAVVKLADKLKVSKLVIALTVVALGTSVPETVVSVMAAVNGSSIAFSNIIGSNIVNICLIFGIPLIYGEVMIHKNMKMEIEKMTVVTGIFIILSVVGMSLTRVDGIIMLLLLSIYISGIYMLSKKDKELEQSDEGEEWIYKLGMQIFKNEWTVIIVFIIIGCLGLLVGGDLALDAAIDIAAHLNVNEGVIGGTIVALGTALPELITTITAMKKKHYDIIIGNVIGSNIVNILMVLGISSILTDIKITGFELEQLVILAVITGMFYLFTIHRKKIGKKEGLILLLSYVASFMLISLR